MQPLVHKHLIVRAEVNSAPKSSTGAKVFLQELIKGIGMKILMGPYAKYCKMVGNRGLTVAAIIETSHVVMHTWDECDPAIIQLDVYTCGALDTQVVFEFLRQFDPIRIDYKYLDRETGLTEIPLTRLPNSATVL